MIKVANIRSDDQHWTLLIVIALAVLGCCPTHRPSAGGASASTKAKTPQVARIPLVSAGDLTKPLTVMDQECMANGMDSLWVASAAGYTPGYVNPQDRTVVYIFPEMLWVATREGDPPGVGTISSGAWANLKDLTARGRVVELQAPVRYLARDAAKVEPGFFDPGHRVFYRWRGVLRSSNDVYFDPRIDPISPVVPRQRLIKAIDIDPPPDHENRLQ
jgi:hypothetical protein